MTQSVETPTGASLWCAVKAQLKKTWTASDYVQWVQPLQLVGSKLGELELGVWDVFAATWLEQNFGEDIRNAAVELAGRAIEIRFVVCAPAPEAPIESHDESVIEPIAEAAPVQAKSEKPRQNPAAEPDGVLNSYTFDNFVVGDENKIAFYSARKAAENPGMQSPLFIYGQTSLGKTHLLHSIALEYARLHPKKVVRYVTCEQMLNDYVTCLQTRTHLEFVNRYRKVDILLVDDIQFLATSERLQEEFFNTFNALSTARKQIVLTSDKPPSEINGLEQRLVARFETGMTTEIILPSYESRLAVLRHFREQYMSNVSDDVLDFLARNINANIMRRLKGAMVQLHTIEEFDPMHRAPELSDVRRHVAGLLSRETDVRRLSIDTIQKKVCDYYNIRLPDLLGKRRSRDVTIPRQVAMYLARKLTQKSYPDIADKFDGKNHVTIMHACRKIESDIESDDYLRQSLADIEKEICSSSV